MTTEAAERSTAGFTRREATVGVAAIGLASALGKASPAVAADTRPNIIFILADDLGYADVSCYGRTDYKTPAIDTLAAGGMRFMQAYANSAVCSATRTGLITGRYQNRLPIGLEEPLTNRDVGLPPSHPTLPSLLRNAGYATWLVGKWHLGMLPKYGPHLSGYDHFWGFRGGGVDYFTHSLAGQPDLWDDDRPIEQPGYMTTLLGNKAVDIIEGRRLGDPPLFMSLHFSAPHWPWEGPGDEAESRRLAAAKGGLLAELHFDGGSMKTYAAMVTAMDAQIGRVLAALDKTGQAQNTIVIFTSDNGGERYSNSWPFTGRKTELLEGGLRIPAIVRWPSRIPAGSVSQQVMISMDWLPTLLAAAGTSPDPRFPPDGIDLAPALVGGRAIRRTLCWRYLNLAQEACRSGDWKYLKILDNRFLFNVVEDPLERANLKDREPAIYRDLLQKYQDWNDKMLTFDPRANTGGFPGSAIVDRFGIDKLQTFDR